MRLATGWVLGVPGIVQVRARVHPDNAASLRTLESAGYTVEGRVPLFFGADDAVVLVRA